MLASNEATNNEATNEDAAGPFSTLKTATGKHLVSGIPVKAWLEFFTVFSGSNRDAEQAAMDVERVFRIELLDSQKQKDTMVQALELLTAKLKATPTK